MHVHHDQCSSPSRMLDYRHMLVMILAHAGYDPKRVIHRLEDWVPTSTTDIRGNIAHMTWLLHDWTMSDQLISVDRHQLRSGKCSDCSLADCLQQRWLLQIIWFPSSRGDAEEQHLQVRQDTSTR